MSIPESEYRFMVSILFKYIGLIKYSKVGNPAGVIIKKWLFDVQMFK